jgi:hypothetical protein
MEEQKYPFKLIQPELRYEFWSRSEEKEIKKIVIFTKIGYKEDNFYNLALMDELANGDLSDISESRNNDMKTILATVFGIANDFLIKNPDAVIAFKGSDERRHRLYRIALNREIDRLSDKFIIAGYTNGEVYPFEVNGVYQQFLIQKI